MRAAHDAVSVRATDRSEPVRIDLIGDAATLGDPEALERALRNVIENAERHARSRIEVRLFSDDDAAVVEIADDGPGFSPEALAHGFDRFTPGDSPDAHGGAGLGLAIVHAIVTAHRGTVEVTNRDGGAVVAVRLPVAVAVGA